ncbi:MAG: aldo/keto reductase [Planctomycetota bacterium]|jgi:aryl-alcohol dehydrogenase-like predicted oxidoreductase|nr:aldo/keto reductase [Planctomycetota bacterium]
MKYKQAKRIAEKISIVGLGCWAFSGDGYWDHSDDDKCVNVVHEALDLGVNLFDVAPVYGKGHAETVLGRSLKGRDRSSFLIASKCGLLWDETGREYNCLKKDSILGEIDGSLRRLGVDYIDIYQLHWPDQSTPIAETLEAIAKIRDAGKIRHLGVTNFNTETVARMDEIVPVDSQQGLYNMLERNPRSYHTLDLVYRTERETLPQIIELGQAFFPYTPFLQGLLTGRFKAGGNFSGRDVRRFNPKLNGARYKIYFDAAEKLRAISDNYGHPMYETAFNWLARNPAVTSVIGSSLTPGNIGRTAKALEWEISPEMMKEIDAVIAPFEDL